MVRSDTQVFTKYKEALQTAEANVQAAEAGLATAQLTYVADCFYHKLNYPYT